MATWTEIGSLKGPKGDTGAAGTDAPTTITTNAQTGTTYTLASSDANGRVTMNNSAANVVTVDASTLTAGQAFLIQQTGAGQTSIAAASGTTIVQGGPTLKCAQQGSTMFVICDSSAQVTVSGEVAAS